MPISKEMMIAAAKAYHSVAFGVHPHALRAALESVLSAAEPVAWLVKRYDLKGVLLDTELSFVRPTIKSTCRTDMVPLYGAPPAPSVAAKSLELDGVPDALAYGKGIWRTCTGCYESNEGYPTGPFSDTLKCHLGGGCFECGGIGAVWDTTDYEEMGNFIALSAHAQDVAESAFQAIADERLRQIGKGYDAAHDDRHVAGEIISATWGASARLWDAQECAVSGDIAGYKKYLVQAAAQIVAEYGRVERAAAPAKQEG